MPNVILLVPHSSERDYREWANFFNSLKQKGYAYLEARHYGVVQARNKLAEEALKTGAEWFFWLDDDLIGSPDCIDHLLAIGRPCACGLYMTKKFKGKRTLAAWMKVETKQGVAAWEQKKESAYLNISIPQPGRYVQVDVTGLGCALVHRSVFEKLPQPWFEWKDAGGRSEDFTFWERVWETQQLKPVVDMECQFEHIGTFKVNVKEEFQLVS